MPEHSAGPDPADVDAQAARTGQALRARFGVAPTHAAVAPGRVNLIGEHTDYNGGFVLPMAIERQTVAVAARRDGRTVRLGSTGFDEVATFELTGDLSPGEPGWSNYVRGVLHGCLAAGLDPGGLDVMIDTTVPVGGGLSSSAALEVSIATLVSAITGRELSVLDKALLCQAAEHTFAGMPCGIMDQYVSAGATRGHAMLIDCKSNEAVAVPLDDPGVAVLVIDSRCKHELVGGEYAERRAQCEAAAAAMGVALLRDADAALLQAHRAMLSGVELRRAGHVIGEDERTRQAAEGMGERDWLSVGRAMYASHASLRDDFEVSTPELDKLVEVAEARTHSGVIGSRMTGGGFGGCTVTLVAADRAGEVARAITAAYREATGIEAAWFVTRPAEGARALQIDAD